MMYLFASKLFSWDASLCMAGLVSAKRAVILYDKTQVYTRFSLQFWNIEHTSRSQ